MQSKKKSKKTKKPITIGIDLMGSDCPAQKLFEDLLSFVKKLPSHVRLVTLGTMQKMRIYKKEHPRLEYIEVKDWISMDDDPILAVRKKKDSSLCTGMQLLRETQIDAFISSGNTGALITSAKLYLKRIFSISRPALMALLPTKKRPVAVLDVGANISCLSKQLLQFAKMGIAFQKCQKIRKPKLGLLNIGTEDFKGPSELKKTFQELQRAEKRLSNHFHFVGNVEGKKLFDGDIDVLICDGFSGNVLLKTAEGLASFILDQFKKKTPDHSLNHLKPIYKMFKKELHYSQYPGALFCGVNGLVIKCHGYSSSAALINAVIGALNYCENNLLEKFTKNLEKISF